MAIKKKGSFGSYFIKLLFLVIIVVCINWVLESRKQPSEPEYSEAYEVLNQFASQYTYLAGTAGYTGYFVKEENQDRYTYHGSIPQIPVTCLQMDFDLDGTEELLMVHTNEDYTMGLYMYEVIDGTAQCTSYYNILIPIAGSAESGLVDGIYYEQNGRINIAFYENSSYGYLGDASFIRFAAVHYNGYEFEYVGGAEYIGSAGIDEMFNKELAAMGIYADLGSLIRGETGIRDYLTNPVTFSESATYCTWTMDDWLAYSDTWYGDPSVTSVQASIIEFK